MLTARAILTAVARVRGSALKATVQARTLLHSGTTRFYRDDYGRPGRRYNDHDKDYDQEHYDRGRGRRHDDGFGRGPPRRRYDRDQDRDFGAGLLDAVKDWSETDAPKRVDYVQPSAAADRTDAEVHAFLEAAAISVVRGGQDAPKPAMNFDETGFDAEILEGLAKAGFERPMPIQAAGWPVAMSGRDLVAIGQTGSGKTLGYLLPALQAVAARAAEGGSLRRSEGPSALVLAPTRELAQQIERVAVKFGRGLARTVCVYGGSGKAYQLEQLDRGVDVLVATPGRLIDLLQTGEVSLGRCDYVVLDEADRMLDMGFEPQIRKVLSQVRWGK